MTTLELMQSFSANRKDKKAKRNGKPVQRIEPVVILVDEDERKANGDALLAKAITNGYLIFPCPKVFFQSGVCDDLSALNGQDNARKRWINDCYDIIHAVKRQDVTFHWTRDFKETNDFRVWKPEAIKKA